MNNNYPEAKAFLCNKIKGAPHPLSERAFDLLKGCYPATRQRLLQQLRDNGYTPSAARKPVTAYRKWLRYLSYVTAKGLQA